MSNAIPGPVPPPVYSPVVRPAVGNETLEQKVQALPPVEQPDQPEKLRQRREGSGRQRGARQGQEHDRREGEPDPAQLSVGGVAAPPLASAPGFRILSTAPAPVGDSSRSLDAFRSDDTPDAGLLLDQRI